VFIRVHPWLSFWFLVLAFAGLALAQTASEKPTPMCGASASASLQVRLQRFGGHLRHARMRLFQARQGAHRRMQAAGFSDQQIIDAFVRDYGPALSRAASAFGWTCPMSQPPWA